MATILHATKLHVIDIQLLGHCPQSLTAIVGRAYNKCCWFQLGVCVPYREWTHQGEDGGGRWGRRSELECGESGRTWTHCLLGERRPVTHGKGRERERERECMRHGEERVGVFTMCKTNILQGSLKFLDGECSKGGGPFLRGGAKWSSMQPSQRRDTRADGCGITQRGGVTGKCGQPEHVKEEGSLGHRARLHV